VRGRDLDEQGLCLDLCTDECERRHRESFDAHALLLCVFDDELSPAEYAKIPRVFSGGTSVNPTDIDDRAVIYQPYDSRQP
jgi:hypothetical protein